MTSKLLLAVVLFWLSQDRMSAGYDYGRVEFKQGEKLVKDGYLDGAYRAFSAAVEADPTNTKYAKKKGEVGDELCNRALAKARSVSLQDPALAYEWVRKALTFNHLDRLAIQEARSLEQRAADAQQELQDAHAAVYHWGHGEGNGPT
jgi:hypothetical protein